MKGSEVFRAFLNESVSFKPDYEKIKPRVFVKPLKTSEATDRKRRGLSFYLKYAVSSVLICSLLCCCLYIAYDDRFPKYTGDPALLSFGLTDVRYISKDSDKVTIDLGKLLNPKRIKSVQIEPKVDLMYSATIPIATRKREVIERVCGLFKVKLNFEVLNGGYKEFQELKKDIFKCGLLANYSFFSNSENNPHHYVYIWVYENEKYKGIALLTEHIFYKSDDLSQLDLDLIFSVHDDLWYNAKKYEIGMWYEG